MEEHLICIYLPYKSQPDKNDGKPSFIKTSRVLYFARYIFYRDLMLERLKIIQYKELYRSVLSPSYIRFAYWLGRHVIMSLILNVLLSIFLILHYIFWNQLKTVAQIITKTQTGRFWKRKLERFFLIKNIQIRTQICKRILHNIQLYDLIIIANLISEIKFHDMLFLHILRIILKNDQSW